ncbi:uncharacterized protein LOC120459760 [Pimephales promelas]|uniref:uncharacterized protein LOC120459760 n=1 Tax=Pimephales promelas TaxID=90988 RepID=UPI001955EB46|nr:uncharacterized protein LOC120459760 [Pimephales promelas]
MLHHFLVHTAFQTSRWLPREQRLKLGLAVALTLTDPVPKSIRVAFHSFGLFAFMHGLCTFIFTMTAPQCVNTTTELYIFSLVVSWACILSTVFFLVRGGLCLIHRLFPHWLRDTSLWG